MSLQDELNQLVKEIEGHKNAKYTLNTCIGNKFLRINEIEKQIADAEKPKLEHLDYGFFPKFNAIGVYLNFGPFMDSISYKSKVNNRDHATGVVAEGYDEGFVKYGNYNDLTAIQEDVTEFEVNGSAYTHDFTVNADGIHHINIIDSKDSAVIQVSHKQLGNLILGLRQMQATLNRKKGSE
jgi:hypothetical protein